MVNRGRSTESYLSPSRPHFPALGNESLRTSETGSVQGWGQLAANLPEMHMPGILTRKLDLEVHEETIADLLHTWTSILTDRTSRLKHARRGSLASGLPPRGCDGSSRAWWRFSAARNSSVRGRAVSLYCRRTFVSVVKIQMVTRISDVQTFSCTSLEFPTTATVCLPSPCWESVVKLSIAWMPQGCVDCRHIVRSLEWSQERKKLEYWIAITFRGARRRVTETVESDVERAMLSLFRQRPSAIQNPERWMAREYKDMTSSPLQLCRRARSGAAQ